MVWSRNIFGWSFTDLQWGFPCLDTKSKWKQFKKAKIFAKQYKLKVDFDTKLIKENKLDPYLDQIHNYSYYVGWNYMEQTWNFWHLFPHDAHSFIFSVSVCKISFDNFFTHKCTSWNVFFFVMDTCQRIKSQLFIRPCCKWWLFSFITLINPFCSALWCVDASTYTLFTWETSCSLSKTKGL